MENEFWIMIDRLSPFSWGWVKVTFVTLGILSFLGLKLHRKRTVHAGLEIVAFLGLCYIFAHGVVTRGVLGTSISHHHGWYYYSILIPHVLCGLAYFIMALILFFIGFRLVLLKKYGWAASRL